MRRRLRFGLLAMVTMLVVSFYGQVCEAAAIAYDDFESYSAGANLDGGSGGMGWTNNWTTLGSHTTVQSKQLDDPNGNIDGGLRAARFQPTTNLSDEAAFIQRGIPVSTGTVYMSFLIRKEVFDDTDFLGFAVSDGDFGDSAASLSVGIRNLSGNPFFARVGLSANTDDASNCASNTDYLIVAKFSKDGSSTYNRTDLFIDPVDENEPGSPDATITAVDSGLSQLSLFSVRNYIPEAGDRVFIDELRFADTFADAVAGISRATAGYDFYVDAGEDTDADEYWEDLTPGNPSGLGLLLDDAPAVTRVAVSNSTTWLTHAYDFPGGATNNEGGALLVTNETTDVVSFQNASTDWSTNDVTLEVWLRPDSTDPAPTNGYIVFEDGGGSGLGLFVVSNKLLCSQDWDTNYIQIAYDLTNDPSGLLLGPATSEFMHVVITRQSTSPYLAEMFINSVSVGTANDDEGDWSGGDAAAFGTRGGNNVGGLGNGQMATESFDGQIALIRIYANQILTVGEVTANFNSEVPDTFAPVVASLSPTNGNPNVFAGSDLVITFNEDVSVTNGGTITIKDLDTPTNLVITIPDPQVTVGGGVLTINPTNSLSFSKAYAVQISTNAVVDAATNYFAGITNDTTWSFTTAAPDSTAPVLTSTIPTNNATGVSPAVGLTATFDDDINAGAGNIVITNLTDSSLVTSIDITDGTQISISSNVLTITPAASMPGGDQVAMLIDSGAVRNVSMLDFAGISDTNTWTFAFRGPTNVVWDGSGDMNWTEPDSTSWSGATYLGGDTARFEGDGAGTVNIDAGGVTPGGVVVDASADYTFSGGGIGGSGPLTKAGSGTLIMSSSNSFSGGIAFSAGMIQVSSSVNRYCFGDTGNIITFLGDARLHNSAGSFTMDQGLTVNDGVLASITGNFGEKTYILGPVSGNGELRVDGGSAGFVAELRNTSTNFTGPISVYGGAGPASLQIRGILDSTNSIVLGQPGASDSCGRLTWTGSAGPLVLNGREFIIRGNNDNASTGRQTLIANSNGGTVNVMEINAGIRLDSTSTKTLNLGGGNTGDNIIGGSITDSEVSGTLNLRKESSGTWILAGANDYSGVTTVTAGKLVLRGEQALLDTGTLNITGGSVKLDDREMIGVLQFSGVAQSNGTWGAIGNGKADYTDASLTGTELLFVGIEFPPGGTVLIIK